eukprot:CAMPEP_0197576138 /NCGR_PEP_ID=MMETSP1326-20131121/1269_1 /TAXON_ID=1155430 /ORGANISM="Genus nov. species nov., Strain RCC2288" /LENGTH=173 /DNA_ID=CAMNT_0043138999 /DNA_START=75 /DNA_END=592 /DNA_ORIENTATION=+
MATSDLLRNLDALVGDEGQVVTYKWAARQFGISSNLAKQLLYAHVKQSGGAVAAVYMLSGWTADEQRRHVVRLVGGGEEALRAARANLAEVTGEHVYSVQPAAAAAAGVGVGVGVHSDYNMLCAVGAKQAQALFDASPDTPNALRDNRGSAVSCAQVKRTAGPSRRVAAKPSA